MAFKILVLKQARKQLYAAIKYYNEQSPGLGHQLLNEFYENLEKLKGNPERHKRTFKHYRRMLFKKFPYKFVFRINYRRNLIIVSGFWHNKQDPNNLKKTLK